MSKHRKLDTNLTIETPEGIDLTVPLAGPVVRILAYCVDTLIRIMIYIGLSIILHYLGKVGTGVMLISFFFVEWFYPVIFEVYNRGMTPGKKNMGILVVHDDSTPIGWSTSIIRNLLRVVDFLPVLYTTGVLSMVFNHQFKRLGDIAAGTLVIYQSTARKKPDLPECAPVQPPISLSLNEQRAILDFSERRTTLSEGRRQELADVLQDMTGRKGSEGVAHLNQIAAGLMGQDEAKSV